MYSHQRLPSQVAAAKRMSEGRRAIGGSTREEQDRRGQKEGGSHCDWRAATQQGAGAATAVMRDQGIGTGGKKESAGAAHRRSPSQAVAA